MGKFHPGALIQLLAIAVACQSSCASLFGQEVASDTPASVRPEPPNKLVVKAKFDPGQESPTSPATPAQWEDPYCPSSGI